MAELIGGSGYDDVQDTPPNNPSIGDTWLDTSLNPPVAKVYVNVGNGDEWVVNSVTDTIQNRLDQKVSSLAGINDTTGRVKTKTTTDFSDDFVDVYGSVDIVNNAISPKLSSSSSPATLSYQPNERDFQKNSGIVFKPTSDVYGLKIKTTEYTEVEVIRIYRVEEGLDDNDTDTQIQEHIVDNFDASDITPGKYFEIVTDKKLKAENFYAIVASVKEDRSRRYKNFEQRSNGENINIEFGIDSTDVHTNNRISLDENYYYDFIEIDGLTLGDSGLGLIEWDLANSRSELDTFFINKALDDENITVDFGKPTRRNAIDFESSLDINGVGYNGLITEKSGGTVNTSTSPSIDGTSLYLDGIAQGEDFDIRIEINNSYFDGIAFDMLIKDDNASRDYESMIVVIRDSDGDVFRMRLSHYDIEVRTRYMDRFDYVNGPDLVSQTSVNMKIDYTSGELELYFNGTKNKTFNIPTDTNFEEVYFDVGQEQNVLLDNFVLNQFTLEQANISEVDMRTMSNEQKRLLLRTEMSTQNIENQPRIESLTERYIQ